MTKTNFYATSKQYKDGFDRHQGRAPSIGYPELVATIKAEMGRWTELRTGSRVVEAEMPQGGHNVRIRTEDGATYESSAGYQLRAWTRDYKTPPNEQELIVFELAPSYAPMEVNPISHCQSGGELVEAARPVAMFIHADRYAERTQKMEAARAAHVQREQAAERARQAEAEQQRAEFTRQVMEPFVAAVAGKTIRGAHVDQGALVIEIDGGPTLRLTLERLGVRSPSNGEMTEVRNAVLTWAGGPPISLHNLGQKD